MEKIFNKIQDFDMIGYLTIIIRIQKYTHKKKNSLIDVKIVISLI